MTHTVCPDCGNNISDNASVCVHCGHSTTPTVASTPVNLSETKKRTSFHFTSKLVAVTVVIVVLLIAIFLALSLLLRPKNNTIVGLWETTIDELIIREEFTENGEFHSSALMSGMQVPGGDGTYTVNGNELTITMLNGNQIVSEFSIKNESLNMNGYIWEKVN